MVQVVFHGPALYAEIEEGFHRVSWARSDDGGESWTADNPVPPGAVPTPDHEPRAEPVKRGPFEVCRPDGSCFRLREQRFIDRVGADGSVKTELSLADAERRAASTGCAGGQRGVLSSVAATGDDVVASLGAAGIVRRSADGTWEHQAVLGIPVPESTSVDRAVLLLALGIGPLAAAAAFVGRKRLPSWQPAVGIAFAGGFGTSMLAAAVSFLSDVKVGPRPTTIATVVGVAITVLATIVVARRPRPLAGFPPPPAPPRA